MSDEDESDSEPRKLSNSAYYFESDIDDEEEDNEIFNRESEDAFNINSKQSKFHPSQTDSIPPKTVSGELDNDSLESSGLVVYNLLSH